ncbi:MAG: hypothetical protein V1875_07280, partial [Candidatus Altiarchaeota archaeon]
PGYVRVLFAEQAGVLSGFFSPMPAGIGVREVVMTESLASYGVGRQNTFSATIVARFVLIAAQSFLAVCAQGAHFLAGKGK